MFPTDARLIDLSIGIEPDSESEPWPPSIDYDDHQTGAQNISEKLREMGYDVSAMDFPDGIALADEAIETMTHTGTHVDAPWHFGPTVDGEPAPTIDELPLEWFVGEAVVLDFTWKEAGSEIAAAEVEAQLEELDHELGEGEIVLIETGADELWGTPEYLTDFPGMGSEATEYILDRGVTVIGTDAYGFDKPFESMAERFVESGDSSELWPAHFVGREREYTHIEKMANFDELPRRTGVPIVTFPVKIAGGSAGWARPVAFVED
ncbi:cyclase family protein [Halobellus sp. GM3]|uniref:cyclase family protein n=1 Tax=Halobellus sp. GM3 TaxID=3458410 RepID=UPI00403E20E4